MSNKKQHIHILGIAGTFMTGIAIIAKQLGYKITGSDNNIYPPMSHQLKQQNIDCIKGYQIQNLPKANLYIIGNALSRGNESVEYILDNNLNYTSGAQWLGDNILKNKQVIAISGTHGKTTTASIISWILEYNKLNPSFLIGGIANNFNISARLTNSKFFVIEADEYDTAFFDKRSKFIHYQPNILTINNIEFDHADIFHNIDDILRQFHYLIRTMPNNALIIYPQNNIIKQLLNMGLWSKTKSFTLPNYTITQNGTSFKIKNNIINWSLLGEHNINNAICAIYAAYYAGISMANSCKALSTFIGVKRRLEVKYQSNNLTIYDDFAHHPSSIKTTIEGLRKKVGKQKIIVVLELRSNTMKMGYFNNELPQSLILTNKVFILNKEFHFNNNKIKNYKTTNDIINALLKEKNGHIVFMSNGNFNNIIQKFINKICT